MEFQAIPVAVYSRVHEEVRKTLSVLCREHRLQTIGFTLTVYPDMLSMEHADNVQKQIAGIIAEYFGTTLEVLKRPNRKRRIILARQFIAYVLRLLYGKTLTMQQICKINGHTHHTTVLYSVKLIQDYLSIKMPEYVEYMEDLKKRLKGIVNWENYSTKIETV